jgi:hypothetical protein
LWGCIVSIALGKLKAQWDVCIQALLFMPAACSLFRQLSPAAQRGLGCPFTGLAWRRAGVRRQCPGPAGRAGAGACDDGG